MGGKIAGIPKSLVAGMAVSFFAGLLIYLWTGWQQALAGAIIVPFILYFWLKDQMGPTKN